MMRFRWLEVEGVSPKDFILLRESINANEYRLTSTAGFKIESSNSKQISARFVKRFDYTEKVRDPFGKIFEMPVFGFDEVDFRFYGSSPQLEIMNASSQAAEILISQLSDYLPQARIVSDAEIAPVKWLNALSPGFESFEVIAMHVSDVPVTNSISARVAFEGVEDVRPGIAKLLGSRSHVVQKLKVHARFAGALVKIELCADCRASSSFQSEKLANLLRQAFAEATNSRKKQ